MNAILVLQCDLNYFLIAHVALVVIADEKDPWLLITLNTLLVVCDSLFEGFDQLFDVVIAWLMDRELGHLVVSSQMLHVKVRVVVVEIHIAAIFLKDVLVHVGNFAAEAAERTGDSVVFY